MVYIPDLSMFLIPDANLLRNELLDKLTTISTGTKNGAPL